MKRILIIFAILFSTQAFSEDNSAFKNVSYDKYLSEYDYPFKVHKYQFPINLRESENNY